MPRTYDAHNMKERPRPNLDLGNGIGGQQWWKALGTFLALNFSALAIGLLQPSGYLLIPATQEVNMVADEASTPAPTESIDAQIELAEATQEAESDSPPPPTEKRLELSVGKGDTLGDMLSAAGISAQEAYLSIKAMSPLFSPRHLRLGQKLSLITTEDDVSGVSELKSLAIKTGFGEEVHVIKNAQGEYDASKREMAIESRPVLREGTIDDSLFLAGERAGVPAAVLIELIQIYSYSVDFQREIRQGDRFRVLYEEKRAEDGETSLGDIAYAELVLRGNAMPLYRFTPSDDGQTDYFGPDGKSTRRLLMKTPVDGARLSSRFGKRKHPVLGYVRNHPGVDFAAPTGTPIYAAGNGVVERASRYGSYGNYIRIRHNGTYKTAYAHLSKYGRGIKAGARVKQGQIIGYVGATGRVTGPHLHYEIYVNDSRVNPLNLKLPTGRNLSGTQLETFIKTRDELKMQLGLDFAEATSVNTQIVSGAN